MEGLLLLIMGAYGIVCLMIGAKIGQQASKGEKIELPTVNPMEIVRERMDKKKEDKSKARMDAIMRNIDAYDGTDMGQEEVPEG